MNRKRNLPLLLTAVIVVLAIAVATARFTAPGHGTFSVRVTDPAGEAVTYAELYLYCFQTGNIEKTFSSDREGRGSVTYRPAFSRAELDDPAWAYRDFLLYARKDGCLPAAYHLTRYYGPEDEDPGEIALVLRPAKGETVPTWQDSEADPAAVRAAMDRKTQPFYVLDEGELAGWNENVPILTLHADQNSRADFTMAQGDAVTVQVGSRVGTQFYTAGSRTRKFLGQADYAPFAPKTGGQRRTYTTSVTFRRYFLIDGATEQVMVHCGMDHLSGGTFAWDWQGETCPRCGLDWDRAAVQGGQCLTVEGQEPAPLAELNDRLLDQGLTRSAPHLGVAGELGVTFRTSDQTRVTYTPRSGSRLRLYDGGSGGTVWHVTSAPE